ncbi:hypothetical protein AWW66_22010 [Micromonospora rosaria]|uniref:Uncharacterized protein n=1 Tax=Micromonospora rosaria TaxID=47874 RepID=A0A136PNB1_9ACTN|nr:hypothetical protein AWW66_22010 [Micromonospora rosaria]
MKRAVEFLFTRVLRSRAGIAVAIAVLVIGVIGAARLTAGVTGADSGLTGGPAGPISTVDPEFGDDGAIYTPSPPAPVTSPGELTPEQIADRFTTAWLGTQGITAEQWHADLRPLSTPALIEKMAGVEPEAVPAGRVTGQPTLRPQNETFVEVLVPLDAGQLRLELVAPEGRWLVDAVDWERG